MKKIVLFCALVVLFFFATRANDKLSLSTQKFLTDLQEARDSSSTPATQFHEKKLSSCSRVDAFLKLAGNSTRQLQATGVEVFAHFGDIATASIPVDAIEEVSKLDEVVEVSVAEPVEFFTDSMRVQTGVEQAQQGFDYGLETDYDGTGVVLGIIDSGFDFNHMAFQDKEGNTRIKQVYFPNGDGTSTSSKVTLHDGTSLPGVAYDSTAVATLTSDRPSNTHGTHTLAIAAGTRVGPYGGMAPGADIVVCALGPKHYDYFNKAAVANSAKFIVDYAKSVGKPCVISMSAGSSVGPRDGSSYLCQAFDYLSRYDTKNQRSGAVICLSAGNYAGAKCDFQHLCTQTDTTQRQFGLMPQNQSTKFDSNVSLFCYSADKTRFGVQYLIFDPDNDSLVYKTPVMKRYTVIRGADSPGVSGYDPNLSKYFYGRIATWDRSDKIRFSLETETMLHHANPDKPYKLALQFYALVGTKIYGMGQMSSFFLPADSIGEYGFIEGNDSCCMNDDATTHSAISVGAYVSKNEVMRLSGSPRKLNYKIGQITNYSSYGVGLDGIAQPFVVAPGCLVVSALNSYSGFATNNSTMSTYCHESATTGKTYYWGVMDGTSMATPCVAGTVALWLQAHPHWTVDSVKEHIKRTAIVDDFVQDGGIRYGHGKINALGGLPKSRNTLSQILTDSTCRVDSICRFTGHSLACIYVSPDGQTIYAKDDNHSITPDTIAADEVDYMKTQTPFMDGVEDYDQSNWVAIRLAQPLDSPSRLQYPGHYLRAMTGKLVCKSSPEIEAAETPQISGDTCRWVPNTFVPASFAGTQRTVAGEAGDSVTYFFVRPKPKEICAINVAMWNARDSVFEVPGDVDTIVLKNGEDSVARISMKGLEGSFAPRFTMLEDSVPKLEDGALYSFLTLVDKQPLAADTTTQRYAVYPLKQFRKLDCMKLRYAPLAAILSDSTCRMGSDYGITDSTLICVYVSPDGQTIYAKDDNGYLTPDVMTPGQVDYIKENTGYLAGDSARYDQSNWVTIRLSQPLDSIVAVNYSNRFLTGFVGRLKDKRNPVFDAIDNVKVAGDPLQPYKENTFLPASFKGSQQVTAANGSQVIDYFFVRPKAMEVAMIDSAMWNQRTGSFEVALSLSALTEDGTSGLQGSFKVDFSLFGDTIPHLTDEHQYQFLAQVRKDTVASPAAVESYVVYPLGRWGDLGPCILWGDANGDGVVNRNDVTAIIQYILGFEPQPFLWRLADVNSNGIIDVSDVAAVINMVKKR